MSFALTRRRDFGRRDESEERRCKRLPFGLGDSHDRAVTAVSGSFF
jgi:hypothetical protein